MKIIGKLISYMYREGFFKNFIRNSINLLSLILPRILRLDKGTETGLMATMHRFLRDQQGDLEDANSSTVYYGGPYVQNTPKKIKAPQS